MLSIKTAWCADWQPDFIGTLLFLVDQRRVLLIEKKTGHGEGKVNAPGGKWDLGETLLECALRETLEETGVVVESGRCVAELRFVERNGPQWLGYVFVATQFSGALLETREAKPFWCNIDAIPYAQMWASDAIWLPETLNEAFLGDDERSPPSVYDFLFTAGSLLDHQPVESTNLSVSLLTPRSTTL